MSKLRVIIFVVRLVIKALKINESETRLRALSFLNDSKLLRDINVSGSITGITVLGSELFVVLHKSPQVSVYNTNYFTLTRTIPIPGSSDLRAIVVSPRHNCLYISDPGLNVVHQYNLSNNAISKWPMGADCYKGADRLRIPSLTLIVLV